MPQSVNPPSLPSVAERKKILLADGALYRARIVTARAEIAHGLKPGALIKDALGRVSKTAKFVLLNTMRSGAINPRIVSTLAMTGLTLLSKTWVRKPLMYVGVAGSAVAAAIYLKKKFGGKNRRAAVD